jgi:RHS repeat-associated protein
LVNSLNQVTGDGMLSFGYDGNGNRSSQSSGGASVTYTYDDENQLVQAETDTVYTPTGSRWKTVWAYDARGRVRVREDYSWYGPGSYFIRDRSARYLYDGMRVIQERNENNTPQVTYTRGLDLAGSWERAGGIGGLLARTAHSGANGVTYTPAFYHADGNGNVTYLLKLDQTTGATYQFDPYGRLLASSGTLAAVNTYRFSSKELMFASGLYNYGYRFYDPNTQRWLNRDPVQETGGINLYGFVVNDPVDWVDASGLSPSCNPQNIAWATGALGGTSQSPAGRQAALAAWQATARAARGALGRSVAAGEGPAHHIATLEARQTELARLAAKGGFNWNGANNGIRLPNWMHKGYQNWHRTWNKALIESLNSTIQRYPNMTEEEAATHLQDIVNLESARLQQCVAKGIMP